MLLLTCGPLETLRAWRRAFPECDIEWIDVTAEHAPVVVALARWVDTLETDEDIRAGWDWLLARGEQLAAELVDDAEQRAFAAESYQLARMWWGSVPSGAPSAAYEAALSSLSDDAPEIEQALLRLPSGPCRLPHRSARDRLLIHAAELYLAVGPDLFT